MRFGIEGQDVTLTYEGVNAAGHPEGNTQHLTADAEPRPIPEAPGFSATSTLTARALESVGHRDGSMVGRSTYEVSEDGSTMTATVSGIDGSGKQFDQVIVFDRVS
jgi:hypothetical protein